MIFLKKLFNFYINSSIHVAFAVFALSWITLLELNLSFDKALLYFIIYATISGYNFVKFFGIVKFKYRELAVWFKTIQIVSLVCFLLMCFYAIQLRTNTLLILSLFVLLTFLYAIPFLGNKTLNLRNISGIKVYVIASVWTGVTVFLPVVDEGFAINIDVVLIAVQRFAYVLVLMIPFEIRDLKFDDLKLETLPQKIGVNNTKILGVLLLVCILILEFFKTGVLYSDVIILTFILTITGFFVIKSKTEQAKYYSSFWVEALPILWLILMLIFT